MTKILLFCLFIPFFLSASFGSPRNSSKPTVASGNELAEMNARLAKGWNTWNTGSVLSHVLLPECFSVNLMLKEGQSGDTLKETLIGR